MTFSHADSLYYPQYSCKIVTCHSIKQVIFAIEWSYIFFVSFNHDLATIMNSKLWFHLGFWRNRSLIRILFVTDTLFSLKSSEIIERVAAWSFVIALVG